METSILRYKQNIFSQNGEDGIIDLIFSRLEINNGTFIEFGAHDGTTFSNSRNLFLKGWKGMFIEADENRFNTLRNTYNNYQNIVCKHQFVKFDENDNLDTIIDSEISSSPFLKEIDFCSIDVDGFDYEIFEKYSKYLPKVLCIEVNAGHDPTYDKLIPNDISHNNIGQSLYMMNKLAEQKGLKFLCYTGNAFFVREDLFHHFQEWERSLVDSYKEFLYYLDITNPGGREHLYKTFVLSGGIYNGFKFDNPYITT